MGPRLVVFPFTIDNGPITLLLLTCTLLHCADIVDNKSSLGSGSNNLCIILAKTALRNVCVTDLISGLISSELDRVSCSDEMRSDEMR